MIWTLLLLSTALVYGSTGAEDEQCHHVGDVAFVIDSSSSIWIYDFNKQIDFVQKLVREFIIGPNDTHVAALTFSRNVVHQFDFNAFDSMDDIVKKIGDITHHAGSATFTNDALAYVNTDMFTSQHGARDGVERVCIVLTDGESTNKDATQLEAAQLKASGVKIMAIGIGKVNHEELKQMVSAPSDETYFTVETFDELEDIKDVVAKKTCKVIESTPAPIKKTTTTTTTTTTAAPTTTAASTTTPLVITTPLQKDQAQPDPQEICQGKEVDIVFIIDSSNSIWPSDFVEQLHFLTKLVELFDVDGGKTRVAMIKFSTEAEVVFYLNQYPSNEEVTKTILSTDTEGGLTYTHLAIQLLIDDVLTEKKGLRPDVAHICVLITDGLSAKPRELQAQTDRLHKTGTYMFAIGVGNVTDKAELDMIASKPSKDFAFEVNGYLALNKIKNILAYKACKVPSDQQRCAQDVKADILFGLYNIGGNDKGQVKEFIKRIGASFGLSSTNVRIGVHEQCGDANIELTDFSDGATYKAAVEDAMTSSMEGLLLRVRTGYGAGGAQRVAILVMAGEVADMDKAYIQAMRLKYNTRVVVVGIGAGTDMKTMMRLASSKNRFDQDTSHVFNINSASELHKLEFKLLRLICQEQ